MGSVLRRRINGRKTYRLWKAAEGAGGGVLPEGILENEPVLSGADRDIIKRLEKIRYYEKMLVDEFSA